MCLGEAPARPCTPISGISISWLHAEDAPRALRKPGPASWPSMRGRKVPDPPGLVWGVTAVFLSRRCPAWDPQKGSPCPLQVAGRPSESSPPIVARRRIPALPSGLPAAWHPGPAGPLPSPAPSRSARRRQGGTLTPGLAAQRCPRGPPAGGSSPGAGRDLAAPRAARAPVTEVSGPDVVPES